MVPRTYREIPVARAAGREFIACVVGLRMLTRLVTVEYSDSASASCPELKRLRESFHDAWYAFKQADEAMHQGVDVTTKENFAGLTDAWDRARLAFETATTALESHQATHGCSSQRSPGILIHRGHGSGRA
jgi:hypothetical protein